MTHALPRGLPWHQMKSLQKHLESCALMQIRAHKYTEVNYAQFRAQTLMLYHREPDDEEDDRANDKQYAAS